MKLTWFSLLLGFMLAGIGAVFAQSPTCTGQTCVYLPLILQPGGSAPPAATPTTAATNIIFFIGPTSVTAPPLAPTPTLPVIQITSVQPGDPSAGLIPPDYGYVTIRNTGSTEVTLTGWTLLNLSRSDSPQFTFPDFMLAPGRLVFVWGEEGVNGPEDLYWGINRRIWQSGDIAVLRDEQGREISRRQVR